MRILQISTCWASTPPAGAGGVEWVVSYLTEQLVRMGHEVSLFATADSVTGARLLASADAPVAYGGLDDEILHVAKACEHIAAGDFDVVHNHHFGLGLVPLYLTETPCVTSLHVPRFPTWSMVHQALAKRHRYVALSRSQRDLDPELEWFDTVLNGIDVDAFPFEADKDDYLLFVGRVSPLKGIHHAIRVAKEAGRPLVIAGPIGEGADEYYRSEVAPHVNGRDVIHTGEVNFAQKVELYRRAAALLFTSRPKYQEPCPLVPIEALSCGTPVISFENGALPEIVSHGEVGFIVEDAEGMSAAVKNLGRIEPAACRDYAERNFGSRLMAERYVGIYERILAGAPAGAQRATVPTGGRV